MIKQRVSQQSLSKILHNNDTAPRTTPYHFRDGVLVGCDWKITTDRFNIILWRKEGKTKPRWRTEGYYSTLGSALIGLLRQGVRDTELTCIQAVQDRVTQLEHDILKSVLK
jgi:hypothetical protein